MTLAAIRKPLKKNVFEAILARHSVRSYAPDELDRDTINTLLEAAVRAPTAMHEEPWAFVVVQDHALLQRLSDQAKPIFVEEVRHRNSHGVSHSFDHFTRPDFNIFHGADTLIIICAKSSSQFVAADCWLAAENLMLVASAIGLGSCVIGSAVAALNIHKVKAELGIPDEYSAIAPIVVGVPSGETQATSRKNPKILFWKN
ncbi:MAG TPA: nitroreductase family protein [Gallionella sp.]|nr:nitroreductase family protein [Gallionella sp.]